MARTNAFRSKLAADRPVLHSSPVGSQRPNGVDAFSGAAHQPPVQPLKSAARAASSNDRTAGIVKAMGRQADKLHR